MATEERGRDRQSLLEGPREAVWCPQSKAYALSTPDGGGLEVGNLDRSGQLDKAWEPLDRLGTRADESGLERTRDESVIFLARLPEIMSTLRAISMDAAHCCREVPSTHNRCLCVETSGARSNPDMGVHAVWGST